MNPVAVLLGLGLVLGGSWATAAPDADRQNELNPKSSNR